MRKNLTSEYQMRLQKRNANICNEFKKLKADNELASSWRVCVVLSEKYLLTPYQVSNIVREGGLYITKGGTK